MITQRETNVLRFTTIYPWTLTTLFIAYQRFLHRSYHITSQKEAHILSLSFLDGRKIRQQGDKEIVKQIFSCFIHVTIVALLINIWQKRNRDPYKLFLFPIMPTRKHRNLQRNALLFLVHIRTRNRPLSHGPAQSDSEIFRPTWTN